MRNKTNSELLVAIGNSVKKHRKAQNLSQEQLAESSGLDRTYISGVERYVRNLTFNSLSSIIKALNLSEKSFFETVIEELQEVENEV